MSLWTAHLPLSRHVQDSAMMFSDTDSEFFHVAKWADSERRGYPFALAAVDRARLGDWKQAVHLAERAVLAFWPWKDWADSFCYEISQANARS